MRNISVNANLNLKEQPQTLYVHGSIMTYAENDITELKKAKLQGINPSILVLDLKVITGDGPRKGTPKHFNYINSEDTVKNYSQVTIRYSPESSKTINIEILG